LKNDILEKGQLESDYFNSQEPSKSLIMFPPDAKGSDSFFKINGGVGDLKELLILTFKLQVLSKIADLEDPVNGAPEGQNAVEIKWVNDLLKEISSEDMKTRGDAINKYLSFSSKLQIAIPGGLIAPLNEISSNNKN